jgi:hypothetical protein
VNPGRAAILGVLLITAATWTAAPARADVVTVLGAPRPSWLRDLVHEMETAGFDARVGGTPGDGGWALRVTSAPDAIDVLGRAAGGRAWIVNERLPVGRTVETRRRAIVRAVEILRARRFSAAAAAARDTSEPLASVAPEPGRAVAPSPVVAAAPAVAPAPAIARAAQDRTPPPVATAEIARPVVERTVVPAGPLSLGIASSVVGAAGGLGGVVGLGLAGRWTGHHLSLWSRGEAAIFSTTVSGAEGSAAIRSAALSLGAGWSPRDGGTARWNPVLGGEATGLLVRAVGEGGVGYRGQTIVVPGLSVGGVAGIRVLLARHIEASVQARAGIVAWEPIIRFAGRRVAAWQGALIATTAELAWRF